MLLLKTVQGFSLLNIFINRSISDVQLGSEYATEDNKPLLTLLTKKLTYLLIKLLLTEIFHKEAISVEFTGVLFFSEHLN